MRHVVLLVAFCFGCTKAEETDVILADFACGPATCIAGEQFCYSESGGAMEDTDPPECQDLPEACKAAPSCACMEAEGAIEGGGSCQEDGTGGITVTVNRP